ncbi:MAG: hypothetical protein M0D55_14765 [Elusimicrobiota bacterium]|nr:MAG: hypothetical protein M0D55_14765 [Elusimicrobiota bacterium]
MKALFAVSLAALLAVPAAAQEKDGLRELKEKYKREAAERRAALAAGGAAAAPAGVPEPAAASTRPAPGVGRAPADLKPALFARYAKGPGGYSLEHLTENLNNTARNISELIGYIRPWREGARPPEGEDLAWAAKALARESAALPELIADGEVALAGGIPRGPRAPDGSLPRLLMYVAQPVLVAKDPTDIQKSMTVGAVRANVAGFTGSLIQLRAENPPQAETEANTETWLQNAKKLRSELDK